MYASGEFDAYVVEFQEYPKLKERVLRVLTALPTPVVQDFLNDERFQVMIDNYQPGQGSTVWMASPGPKGSGSRSVVLRPRLENSSEAFALYVIAHEFAHAHLRNGGWGDIHDPEEAADALAAEWGYPRPRNWWIW